MKQLKFNFTLFDLIQNGGKTSTYVMFDEQNLAASDEVLFVRTPEIIPFAKAKLTRVYEKKFKELSELDQEGHEKLMVDRGMYKIYTGFEGKPVTGETPVKIIKFGITEWL